MSEREYGYAEARARHRREAERARAYLWGAALMFGLALGLAINLWR